MKTNRFALHLGNFFSTYLVKHRNASKNTIYAYRDTFKLLFRYCESFRKIRIENICFSTLTRDFIKEFLDWLEGERKCSIATRNQRLAALHSFFRYVQSEEPECIYNFQQITSIPRKKEIILAIKHLSPETIKLILQQPDKSHPKGRRDLTLLSILYDTGARVQELCDIKVCDVTLQPFPTIELNGKGGKIRRVPLMPNTAKLLQSYMTENKLNERWKLQSPLFANPQKNKLSKEGVAYILNRYAKKAGVERAAATRVTPHVLRHSKAMHLLQAGVNMIYIRDFLGHVDIKTTEIYARIDTETKRRAIENAYPDIIDCDMPDWNKNRQLLEWLSTLKV